MPTQDINTIYFDADDVLFPTTEALARHVRKWYNISVNTHQYPDQWDLQTAGIRSVKNLCLSFIRSGAFAEMPSCRYAQRGVQMLKDARFNLHIVSAMFDTPTVVRERWPNVATCFGADTFAGLWHTGLMKSKIGYYKNHPNGFVLDDSLTNLAHAKAENHYPIAIETTHNMFMTRQFQNLGIPVCKNVLEAAKLILSLREQTNS